jgi:exodeoxyribonuclease VII large subunit
MWLRARWEGLAAQRPFRRPFDLVHDRSRRLDELALQTSAAVRRIAGDRKNRLATLAAKIESLSPLQVLARGYTITQDAKSGKVVRNASELRVGQSIVTRFTAGAASSKVESLDISTPN